MKVQTSELDRGRHAMVVVAVSGQVTTVSRKFRALQSPRAVNDGHGDVTSFQPERKRKFLDSRARLVVAVKKTA